MQTCGNLSRIWAMRSLNPKDNWNYSRSLLFAWLFRTTTLACVNIPVATNFTVALHVVKRLELQHRQQCGEVPWTRGELLASGSDRMMLKRDGWLLNNPRPSMWERKKVFDFIVTQNVTDAFALTLNAINGDETLISGLKTWRGAAV